MMFVNHQTLGLGAGLAVIKHFGAYLPQTSLMFAIPLMMLGILLPDIDTPHSYLGRRVPFISYPLFRLFGHRGMTHSLLFSLGIMYFLHNSEFDFSFWIGFGCLLHLLADMCTKSGVPLLWPLPKRFNTIITVSTGDVSEYFIAWAVFIVGTGYYFDVLPYILAFAL
ncbi:MAG: inner membrane protein [Oleiphilaceae bacterium]|jgi:inner membrane protein